MRSLTRHFLAFAQGRRLSRISCSSINCSCLASRHVPKSVPMHPSYVKSESALLRDLTQEPEMIRAFRDTWELGIHSYLTYLRDRLLLARDLLHETGSCFVQISDENLHYVREILDDVFGPKNFVATVCYT